MSAPVARLESVGLAYGKTRALDAITFDVPSGRIVGLIGPDGVGVTSAELFDTQGLIGTSAQTLLVQLVITASRCARKRK